MKKIQTYNFSTILDLAQRSFGMGASEEIKPIKWLVSPEQLHKFMLCVLEDHGVIKKPAEEKKSKKKKSK